MDKEEAPDWICGPRPYLNSQEDKPFQLGIMHVKQLRVLEWELFNATPSSTVRMGSYKNSWDSRFGKTKGNSPIRS